MKKRVNLLFISIFCILIFSLSFSSAGFFNDFFNKLSGKSIDSEDQDLIQDSMTPEELKDSLPAPEPDIIIETPEESLEVQKDQLEEEIIEAILETPETITPINTEANNFQSSQQREDYTKNYQGYLIEFEKKPIAVKKLELNQKQEKKESNFFFKIFGKVILTGNTVQEDLEEYKQNLRQENQKVKQRISQKLVEQGKTLEIINEHEVLFNGIFVDFSDSEAKLIENVKGVKKIHKNLKVQATLMDSVPLINADDVWNLNKDLQPCDPNAQVSNKNSLLTGEIVATPPYSVLPCLTGQGISIAILDTGIDYTHSDLGGCFGENCKVKGGYDFINDDDDPMDDHGHGTHCAGIVAGKGVLKGVAPDANLYAYKVLNSGGSGSWDQVIAGIEIAIDPNQDGIFEDHLDIISMSLSGNCGGEYHEFCGPDDLISSVVDNAVNIGCIFVVAASNEGPKKGTIGTPGVARKAITVGASDKQNQITSFSSRGPIIWKNSQGNSKSLIKPDVIAPGAEICSSQWENAWQYYECVDNEHTAISGTSMATPHVAGAIALLKQKNPEWTPEEIKIVLKNTAISIGEEAVVQGQGRIDSLEAINVEEKPTIAKLQEIDYFPENSLDIYGTAKGENFDYYKVYYLDKIGTWNLICQGNDEVEEEILCGNFNVENLIDGKYYIKLEVYTSQGKLSKDYGIFEIDNVKLLAPKNYEIIKTGEVVKINAMIKGNFQTYNLQYKKGDEGSWTDTNIVIYNINPPINGEIAKWGTFGLDSGKYFLRLSVSYPEGDVMENVTVYIDSSLNWIYNIPNDEKIIRNSMSITNFPSINGNNKEVVFMTYKNPFCSLSILDSSGNKIRKINVDSSNTCSIPSIANLDGIGEKEILFITNPDENHPDFGKAYLWAFYSNGTVYQNYPIILPGAISNIYTFPIIADLDGDKNLEIIASSGGKACSNCQNHGELFVFDINGNILSGWPYILKEGKFFRSPITISEIDNDGKLEIMVTVFNSNTPNINLHKTFAFNHDASLVQGFPFVNLLLGSNFWGWSLASGDVNSLGSIDIITQKGFVNGFGQGTPWEMSAYSDFSLGKFTNNEGLGIFYGGADCKSYLIDFEGNPFENWPIFKESTTGRPFCADGSPIIADLTGNNNEELIPVFWDNLFYPALEKIAPGLHIYSVNGNPIEEILNFEGSFEINSIATNDLNSNSKVELIIASDSIVFSKEFEKEYNLASWPMFQHDPRHTGNYHACSDGTFQGQCSSPKPLYCGNRVLFNDCQECGCLENQYCLPNGACSNVFLKNNPPKK